MGARAGAMRRPLRAPSLPFDTISAMLSTTLSTILAALSLLVALFACWFAYSAARFCAEKNARSVSLKKITELATSVGDLQDSYEALYKSYKRLNSRKAMRDAREAKTNGTGEPDSRIAPDEWKRWARVQLQQGTLRK